MRHDAQTSLHLVGYMRQRLIAFSVVSAVLLCLSGVSQAQVTPSGLGTAVNPVGATYEITGGARPGGGTNLFHSFGQFSILAGETALFKDPAPPPTLNIIGRVTDGIRSDIYGTIDTAIYYPGANLFLINPAGVVFGATATLNVGGSVNISTADYLRLSDGVRFEAIPGAQDALLSTASVAAFGFLGTPVGPITFEGANLSMPAGQSLTAVGGDITVTADSGGTPSFVSAPGGQIRLASVASPGEILESNLQSAPNINGQSFTTMGTVTLSQGSTLDVSGDGPAAVVIRGGQLMMNSSVITAGYVGVVDNVVANTIDINMQGNVTISNGSLLLVTSAGTGSAGDIQIISGGAVRLESGSGILLSTSDAVASNLSVVAPNVSLAGGSIILSDASGAQDGGNVSITASNAFSISGADAFGNVSTIQSSTSSVNPIQKGGAITITSGSATVADLGSVQTSTSADGKGGDINLQVGNLGITGGGSVQTFGSAGSSGGISISANDTVSVSGQFDVNNPSRVLTVNNGTGGTGDITITARTFELVNGANIDRQADFPQSGGIAISATDSVTIANGGKIRMGVITASGGPVNVSAPSIVIDQGVIQTLTIGGGNAGTVGLNAGSLILSNASLITSETQGAGTGGTIGIQAGQVQLSGASTISAQSTSTGDAGNIAITANQLNLFDSSITTQATLASGGNVTIMAGELVRLNNSKINTSVAGGPTTAGGDIVIDPPFVVLQNNSQILAQAFAGLGGNITIVAGALFVDPTSSISASSQLGISGSVNVQSPVFFLSGSLVPLPKTPVQAASLLQARCAARMQGGQESNFVQRGRDGLPPEPGGWLASPMLAAGSPSTLRIGQDEQSTGQDVMLAQADFEGSPIRAAISNAGPLTRMASASATGGCGLELVLAQ